VRQSERPLTEKWEWRGALNGDDQRLPAPTLKELYSKPRRSNAWESEEAEVVRFWTDDGDSWGFLFHYLTAIHYSAKHDRLLITWTLGTLVIVGPKVLEFYDDFLQSPGNVTQSRWERHPRSDNSVKCGTRCGRAFAESLT
jgi:hypothetical protein